MIKIDKPRENRNISIVISAAKVYKKSQETYIKIKEADFAESNNPVYILEAFFASRFAQLPPPEWVLSHFANAFLKYYSSPDIQKGDLDKLLGFSRGEGKENAFKELVRKNRDELLCLYIFKLREIVVISIDAAVHMVYEFQVSDCYKQSSPFETYNITYDEIEIKEPSLRDIYLKKGWSKRYKQNKDLNDEISQMTEQEKSEFLSLFPPHSFPLNFHRKNSGMK